MFDDVRPHSQGRTFIFPVGSGGGEKPHPSLPHIVLCDNYCTASHAMMIG